MNELRQQSWILRMRNGVRKCKNTCFLQKKKSATTSTWNPLVTRLSLQSFVRPFNITGMEYYGEVSATVGRIYEKSYIALFTCMSLRASHLEIANYLNTDSDIIAIRFIRRRNGANMYSANRKLKETSTWLKQIWSFSHYLEIYSTSISTMEAGRGWWG